MARNSRISLSTHPGYDWPQERSVIREDEMRERGNHCAVLSAAGLAAIMFAAPAAAQAPAAPTAANPWVQVAPFPNPSEEVLGAAANGKLYVFAGLAPGWKSKAAGHRIRSRHQSVVAQEADAGGGASCRLHHPEQ
jgi:hypothetical protein